VSGPKFPPGLPGRLLTAKEVAEILNLSVRTVRRLIAQKKLATILIGRSLRIRLGALEALINGQVISDDR
jgi:excisionase family DNA binding protein